jgi:hypothetical protein
MRSKTMQEKRMEKQRQEPMGSKKNKDCKHRWEIEVSEGS